MGDARRAHVLIAGHVQGVGFRYSTLSRARSLQLGGWVRNCGDGRVEAVFEGPAARVESMLDWCRRGPGGAVVEVFDVAWEPPQGDGRFEVR